MKGFTKILAAGFLFAFTIFLFNCTPSRIIKQTGNMAIVQGLGATKIEAKMNAEEEVKKIFPKYKITKEPEYTQEHRVDTDEDYKVSGGTFWSCVLEAEKVE